MGVWSSQEVGLDPGWSADNGPGFYKRSNPSMNRDVLEDGKGLGGSRYPKRKERMSINLRDLRYWRQVLLVLIHMGGGARIILQSLLEVRSVWKSEDESRRGWTIFNYSSRLRITFIFFKSSTVSFLGVSIMPGRCVNCGWLIKYRNPSRPI